MDKIQNIDQNLNDIYNHLEFDPALTGFLTNITSIDELVNLFKTAEEDIIHGMRFLTYQKDDYACVLSIGKLSDISKKDLEENKNNYDFHYFLDDHLELFIYYSLVE